MNGNDASHHDDHQDDQDDQECPPSMGMFLMVSLNVDKFLLLYKNLLPTLEGP